jgi:hypothetical protein
VEHISAPQQRRDNREPFLFALLFIYKASKNWSKNAVLSKYLHSAAIINYFKVLWEDPEGYIETISTG